MGEGYDVAGLCAGIAAAVAGHGDLDAAVRDVHRLPPDLPARGTLAAALVEVLVRGGDVPGRERVRQLAGLLELTDGVPATPQWVRSRTVARTVCLMSGVAEREITDLRAASAELEALVAASGSEAGLAPLFDAARAGIRLAGAVQGGDPMAYARFSAEMAPLLDRMPAGDPRVEALRGPLAAASGAMAGDGTGMDLPAALDALRRAADGLGPGQLREELEEALGTVSPLAAMGPDGGQRLTDEQLEALRAAAGQPGLSDSDRALAHTAAAAAAMQIGQETDLDRVEAALDDLRRAARLVSAADPQRVFHLTGVAMGLYRRFELTAVTADLREAAQVLAEAKALAGGPQHPQWQLVNEMLGEVHRLLGDAPDPHRSGLAGLRGLAWQVLVQPDLAGASAAARSAGADAVDIARRCLIAGDPEGAIAALDAGRGLALFAAAETANVAARLDAAGEPDLARRWRAAAADDPADLPAELRRDVMAVLAAHSTAAALLDPPQLGEIQDALAALDADALVYLVPTAGPVTGFAVVAPVSGPASFVALPNLTAEDPDIERYLAAVARRDLGAVSPGGAPGRSDELSRSLEQLCDWAWRAAMGPVVEGYLPRLRPPAHRPPRIVLVPMGDLARVPWQAAKDRQGHYVVERIAISQAASARMLCRSAALSPVPVSSGGLLVGDPDTGGRAAVLNAARTEAYAVREALYRGARYLGRLPKGTDSRSGRGTVAEVRSWLTSTGPVPGSMLHLACHGVVRTGAPRPSAHLLLADGAELRADELVALLAAAPDRAVGLVVLAGCHTGEAMHGYDEAYSLGAAFLAGGVRSVLSSQWSVLDRETSVLMFMVHHFLRTGRRPAWAALRDAQLWMLDPQRRVPEEMPEPLRRQLDLAKLDHVVAWAAFGHWGQ